MKNPIFIAIAFILLLSAAYKAEELNVTLTPDKPSHSILLCKFAEPDLTRDIKTYTDKGYIIKSVVMVGHNNQRVLITLEKY